LALRADGSATPEHDHQVEHVDTPIVVEIESRMVPRVADIASHVPGDEDEVTGVDDAVAVYVADAGGVGVAVGVGVFVAVAVGVGVCGGRCRRLRPCRLRSVHPKSADSQSG